MINATELRIGNLVKCKISNDAGIYTVTAIDGLHLKIYLNEPRNVWHNEDKIKPIPLTEEWLLKFSWIWNNETKSFEKLNFPQGHIIKTPFGFMMFNYVLNSITTDKDFNFVHELQNIFFALKKEELKLK